MRMDIVLGEESVSFKVELLFADLLLEPQLQVGEKDLPWGGGVCGVLNYGFVSWR